MRNLFIADVIWQTMRILLGFSTKTKTNMMMEGKESGYVARNPNNTVHDINRNDDDGNDADIDSWGVLIAVFDKAKSRLQASSFPQARCKNYIKQISLNFGIQCVFRY